MKSKLLNISFMLPLNGLYFFLELSFVVTSDILLYD